MFPHVSTCSFRRLICAGAAALVALAFAPQAAAQESAPAFPGAEGHGRYVTGGRGGKVIHVTNLNDSGTGSLREAISQKGARIIVFDVAGYIDLKSDLVIKYGDLTIAGQTAPAPGITLRYRTVKINDSCSNLIMRFIRIRRSQVQDVNSGADASWGRNAKDIIIDHCSLSWSIDEVASYYDNRNFTFQWSFATEGLANAGHSKGAHSYGGIWGGKDASFHHSMIAHVQNRAPRFNGARYNWSGYDTEKYDNTLQAERVDFRNCVIYNWGTGNGCYGGPGGGYINIVNNYYKSGPATTNKTRVTQVSVGTKDNMDEDELTYLGYASRYYINGNYVTAAGSKAANYDWSGVKYDSGLSTINSEYYIPDANHYYGDDQTYVKNSSDVDCIRLKLDEAIDAGDVTTHSAENAYNKVLAYGGACLYRDAVDSRNVEEATNGTTTYTGETSKKAGIIDLINDPTATTQYDTRPSFPELESTSRPDGWDTDGDGMPDAWETLNGLDPNDASDGATYTLDSKKFYTNVEVYANSLVESIMKAGNADAISAVDEYYPVCKSTATAIAEVEVNSEVIGFEYYSLQGKRLAEPAQGISVRRTLYSNGSAVSDLVIKK